MRNRPQLLALDPEVDPPPSEEEAERIRGWLRFSKGKHFDELRAKFPDLYDPTEVVDGDGWWSKDKEREDALAFYRAARKEQLRET